MMAPSLIVNTMAPETLRPRNGVLWLLERSRSLAMTNSRLGLDHHHRRRAPSAMAGGTEPDHASGGDA